MGKGALGVPQPKPLLCFICSEDLCEREGGVGEGTHTAITETRKYHTIVGKVAVVGGGGGRQQKPLVPHPGSPPRGGGGGLWGGGGGGDTN